MQQVRAKAKPTMDQERATQRALKQSMHNSYVQYRASLTKPTATGASKMGDTIFNIFTADECATKLANKKPYAKAGAIVPATTAGSSMDEWKGKAAELRKLVDTAFEEWTVELRPKWEHMTSAYLPASNTNVYLDLNKRMKEKQFKGLDMTQWELLDTTLDSCMKTYNVAHAKVLQLMKDWPEFAQKLPGWRSQDETEMVQKPQRNQRKTTQPAQVVVYQHPPTMQVVQQPPQNVQYVHQVPQPQQVKYVQMPGNTKKPAPIHNHIHYHGSSSGHADVHNNPRLMLSNTRVDHMHQGALMPDDSACKVQTGSAMNTGSKGSQDQSMTEDDDHVYCTCAVPEPVHMMDTGAHIRRVWPNTGKNRRPGTGARGNRKLKLTSAKTGPKAMMQTPGMGSQPMYMAQPMMYAPATAQQPIMYAPAMGAPVVSQGMVPMHYVYQ
jgi:hypothetical protein